MEESAADKELASGVCNVLPSMADPEDWSETAISAEGELPPVSETEEDSFSITPVLPTVPDPSLTSDVAESFPVCPVPSVGLAPEESVVVVEPSLEESVVVEESAGGEESEVGVPKPGAVPESFPVDPVAPVGLPPEESVVVVEPSLEESVAESGGEEESDVDVILEESVEESGGEEESELGTALGDDSTTGCPELVPSVILVLSSTPVFSKVVFVVPVPVLEVAISALAKNPIGYVIIERESTSIMHIANICAD